MSFVFWFLILWGLADPGGTVPPRVIQFLEIPRLPGYISNANQPVRGLLYGALTL